MIVARQDFYRATMARPTINRPVDREEDGEMTSGHHGLQLQEIEMNGIYVRRANILHWVNK